jgi:hypothetical protein
MSSGLPINTLSQAEEYRKRYLATLALEAQNNSYNLQANQVYKQTGQPSRPPDMRSTTEKFADIEKLKVDLRQGLTQLTDGIQAGETIEQLTPDEVSFAVQQLPAIVADLKPKFSRGAPANALVAYIRALRRKFLATNGVSFTSQEATAQQILNALQAGINMLGANPGPFGPIGGTPGGDDGDDGGDDGAPEGQFAPISPAPINEAPVAPIRPIPGRPGRPPSGLPIGPSPIESIEPFGPLPTPIPNEELMQEIQTKGALSTFKNDATFMEAAKQFGPNSQQEWDEYPMQGGFNPYPDNDQIAIQFLKWWIQNQTVDVQLRAPGWQSKKTLSTLKNTLTPAVEYKLSLSGTEQNEEPEPFQKSTAIESFQGIPETSTVVESFQGIPETSQASTVPEGRKKSEGKEKFPAGIQNSIMFREKIASPKFSNEQLSADVRSFLLQNQLIYKLIRTDTKQRIDPNEILFKGKKLTRERPVPYERTNLDDLIIQIRGRGIISRAKEPASRFPSGRHILGYGLSIPKKQKKSIQVDMTQGLAYESQPTFIPFGKYIVNPSKLSSGVFDMRTLNGNKSAKYPIKTLSPKLTKHINKILNGKGIDNDDFSEMNLEDQHFLYNLANDAKINDRLKLPTPKLSKDGEEENRFEILKGEICSGNDNKELIKEFKQMLIKFSNDGRIKKNEAREILLDLTSLGY